MEASADRRPVIVTGASGIAGWHLLQALGDRRIDAIGVSRREGADGLKADLTDAAAVASMRLSAGVVHAAGLTPHRGRGSWEAFRDANVRTTEILATEAVAQGARFFVYLSTAGVYARRHRTPTGRFYVVSKLLAERRLRQIARGRVPLWILRPASLYGARDTGSVARLIRAARRGRLLLPGGGNQRKCLLYAGTLAQAVTSEIAEGLAPGARTE
nr:NAD(P)-dependent oxidoreductase [Actinomycetota bacterium]